MNDPEMARREGERLIMKGRLQEGLQYLETAFADHPNDFALQVSLVKTLIVGQQYNRAKNLSKCGMRHSPDQGAFPFLLGLIAYEQERFVESSQYCWAALNSANLEKADTHNASLLLSKSLLMQGRLAQGWPPYVVSRLKHSYPEKISTRPRLERWDRVASLFDQAIVVIMEQGLGDEIAMLSLLDDISGICKDLHVVCDRRLCEMVRRRFPSATFYPRRTLQSADEVIFDVSEVINEETNVATFAFVGDFLPSLRRTPDSFPVRPHCLISDPAKVEQWRIRLNSIQMSPKLGLSWRSGFQNVERDRAFTSFSTWVDALRKSDATFINLQYDDCQDEIAEMEEAGIRILDFSRDIDLRNDLNGIVALCAALDGVISVFNAVGALAAASNTPTVFVSSGPAWTSFGKSANLFLGETTNKIVKTPREALSSFHAH